MTRSEFLALLNAPEGTRLECKEARARFEFDELVRYCVALANEGGGTILLGVTDTRPRTVVGSQAFSEPGRTEAGIFERLGHRVSIEELIHDAHRVLIVRVPPRSAGAPWSDRGQYWMRAGDALQPMSDDTLRAIHNESARDFSAEICPDAVLADLAATSMAEFRRRWAARSGNDRILAWTDDELLRNAELTSERGITFAALLLLGTTGALGQFLPQAEIVFEYRSSESAGPAQDRLEFREGFLGYHDRLWDRINQRNERQSYQDGFFRAEVATFDEQSIREAILNAFCHRDYRLGASVFVRQFARRLEVVSPGGFPAGITPDNVLDQQNPRNRRLAEACARCGLIERAGQGMNVMFEQAIKQSKPLPDFRGSAGHEVRLTLRGDVSNPAFLRFIERVGAETLSSFDTRDLLVLDSLQRGEATPDSLRDRLPRLLELGLIERIGGGRGTRYLLSRRYYSAIGERGTYTRRRGLDRGANRELLMKHLIDVGADGSPFSELQQVLPGLSRGQLRTLLVELRDAGRVRVEGLRRWARWFAVGV